MKYYCFRDIRIPIYISYDHYKRVNTLRKIPLKVSSYIVKNSKILDVITVYDNQPEISESFKSFSKICLKNKWEF